MPVHRFLPQALLACWLFLSAMNANAQGWTDLLADDSLEAWRGYNQEDVPAGWQVKDGVLTRSGQSVTLITREQHENFEFAFEWKISSGGNSGVLYHVLEEEGPPYHTGPEYQVLDNEAHGLKATANTASGALYGLYPPAVDASKPAGEWNTGKIVANGPRVEHWLNGQKVLECELGSDDWYERVSETKFAVWPKFGKSSRGHLALQDHGHEVSFRKLRIRSLPVNESPESSAIRAPRVLFVCQSAGFRHSTVTRKSRVQMSHSEKVMKELGIKSGDFRVDCTQDVEADFKPELIENYDVVMFFTTGKMFGNEQVLPIPQDTLDWFLNDWLRRKGNGFLGVHAATDTFADYQPYWDMIGGSFAGHPWTAGHTVSITVHDTEHPAMRPWGSSFVIQDEIYRFKNWQPEKVRVLMSLDMANTELKEPYHVPICWVKPYGEGRVMHMSLGHREDVWSNEKYQQSLLGGIHWLLGKEEGDATPNPELSAEEEEKARAAAPAE